MNRLLPALGLAALVLLARSTPAEACSCIYQGPACQTFWKTDAVFDATVESIEARTRQEDLGTSRPFPIGEFVVKMNVRQAWKGVQQGPIEVVTNQQSSACGFSFHVGKRYVVFAYRRTFDGRWGTSICSLTKEYNGTGDTAEFLASLAQPPRGGRIFGVVKLTETFVRDGIMRQQPVETEVHLVGGGRTQTVVSKNGRYEFAGLADGHYRVELRVPDGYMTYEPGRDAHLPNGYACSDQSYYLASAGRITGRVVGPDGRPPRRTRIEAALSTAQTHRDYGLSVVSGDTDVDGYFQIERLPEGTYILGLNLRDLPNDYYPYPRTLYPSDGSNVHQITLSHGQTYDVGTWRIPAPLAPVKVTGVITWLDGTPAAGVYVHAWDQTGNPVEQGRGVAGATADAQGRFGITLRANRIYRFTAARREGGLWAISAPKVNTGAEVPPIHIVIQQQYR